MVTREHSAKKFPLEMSMKYIQLIVIILTLVFQPGLVEARTILFAGDSIMAGVGPVLANLLPKSDISLQGSKVSSGLVNQKFFHWTNKISEYMTIHNPDIVFFCIGTNDVGMSLTMNGKRYHFGSDVWDAAYAIRFQEIVSVVKSSGGSLVFVTPPIMKNDTLEKGLVRIIGIIKNVCVKNGVVFLDTRESLTKNSNYQQYLTIDGVDVAVRTLDGVHLTGAGNKIFAKKVFEKYNNLCN